MFVNLSNIILADFWKFPIDISMGKPRKIPCWDFSGETYRNIGQEIVEIFLSENGWIFVGSE